MLSTLEKHIDSPNDLNNDKRAHATAIIDPCSTSYQEESDDDDSLFEETGLDAASIYQNTYFMDGDNHFISLPSLGNSSSSKDATFISRLFEEWLEQKLRGKQADDPLLPILEDNVDSIANEILDRLKHEFIPKSVSKALLKIRTGHVYTYHQLEDGQPLITQDMEEFFQQFPLFVEITIHTTQNAAIHETSQSNKCTLLLSMENVTVNPGNPYRLMDEISLSIPSSQ